MTEREFTAAAERHLDTVYRVALNCLRNPADAEDAAQTVLLRLWQSGQAFPNDDQLRYWLVRVTVNVCKDVLRSPWRRRMVALDHCREPAFAAPEHQALYAEVMALPAKYRLPLYLYYYEGYTAPEVGELLGLKPSTVQTRLSRAREKLKAQLKEE
ncbi:sigma-70 family RNA polymerase sigma factor [Oscillibacter sp.]|uniref:RNA polymerase sigma factor n=1 Tax=Oscillospiraceae TaxID=216572 RepID=UPI001F8D48AF|nr:sigma-70 family RNA polymerase sigma factor [Oscillibacter sp.]MBS6354753.1 sigma-70 family RNA polymerase sigma factor [Oscillibacter sp.]HJB52844.1 sigma-70 family RNA polymerase sigma factor [Candidatus Oscillibacter pullicola]